MANPWHKSNESINGFGMWALEKTIPISRRRLLGMGAGLLCPLPGNAKALWFNTFNSLTEDLIQHPLHIKGRLPSDLKGHLYRAGPVHFEQPDGKRYQHWFDGDGGLLDIHLNGHGLATATMRLLRTPGFVNEQQAGAVMYPSYGTPTTHALRKILRQDFKNVANTNVVSWNDQLYALVESTLPTAIEPNTLERIDETTFGGVIRGGFSAHPHRHTGGKTLYNVGMELGLKSKLHIYAMNQSGQNRRLLSIPKPHCAMLHDFALTEKHIVLLQPPIHLDFKKVIASKGAVSEGLVWNGQRGTQITVIPINDPDQMRSWEVDPFYQWHIGNAWELGPEIFIDLVKYRDFSSNKALGNLIHGYRNTGELNGRLTRLRFNQISGTLATEFEAKHSGEFPQVSSGVWAQRNRYVYLAEHSSEAISIAGLPDTLSQYDLKTGQRHSTQLSATSYPTEPVAVPKTNAKHSEDCWILSVIYDAHSQTSKFTVFDSEAFSAGPVATGDFGRPIPMTFHGHWQAD